MKTSGKIPSRSADHVHGMLLISITESKVSAYYTLLMRSHTLVSGNLHINADKSIFFSKRWPQRSRHNDVRSGQGFAGDAWPRPDRVSLNRRQSLATPLKVQRCTNSAAGRIDQGNDISPLLSFSADSY